MSKYVYPYSRKSAENDGHPDLWRESNAENIACAKAIKDEIDLTHDGTCLGADSARRVIDRFGYDRVNWVLSATVQQMSKGVGLTQENKDWAGQYFMAYLKKEIVDYRVDVEPAKLNSFVGSARREYDSLHLFDHKHCIPDSGNMDYKERVLVLRPSTLNDQYKSPDNQLFIADIGGFGCSPTGSGRRVMGHFLIDGEKSEYYRSDFVGIIADEHLPQWATEALEQRQSPDSGIEQTMTGI